MKQVRARTVFFSIILLLFVFLPFVTTAQCPDAGFDPGCDPVTCLRQDGSYCPIDSNLYILLAAGIFYGFKKIKERKKTELRSNEQ